MWRAASTSRVVVVVVVAPSLFPTRSLPRKLSRPTRPVTRIATSLGAGAPPPPPRISICTAPTPTPGSKPSSSILTGPAGAIGVVNQPLPGPPEPAEELALGRRHLLMILKGRLVVVAKQV